MKLAAKLMLTFFTAVILITVVFSYLLIRQDQRRFRQDHRRDIQKLAAAIEPLLEAAWNTYEVERLNRALTPHVRLQHDYRIRWVLLNTPDDRDTGPYSPAHLQQALTQRDVISIAVTDPQGQARLLTYCPLDLDEDQEPDGGLEFAVALRDVADETRETVLTEIVSLAAMAVVGCGVVLIVGVRMVGRPLETLIDKAQRVGAGDFEGPVDIQGRDELRQLGAALNDMCQRLQQQQQRLRAETASRVAALEQLRHVDRLKTVGRLAAGIAHEMGTPLNVISGRAGMISSGRLGDEKVRDSADAIKSEADRIASIIRQLLDFARPSSSQRRLQDVRPVASRTLELLQPLAEKRGVQCTLEPATDDAAPPHANAIVDANQLQQVLTNLLMNAIQSTAAGGSVTVSVRPQRVDRPSDDGTTCREVIALAIQDTGCGIPAEDQADIFEPFFTTKDVGEGTGLGLSIAYGIVQEHGGWIDVASEPGQGSRFTVYLSRA